MRDNMSKKAIIFESIVIILAIIYYVIWIEIPDIKKSIGSSDYFINTSKYNSSLEIKIDHNTHFMYIFDKKNSVYYIFFLNKEALYLYNQNIEGLNYSDAFSKSIEIIKDKGLLNKKSIVEITNYNNVDVSIISSFKSNLYEENTVTVKESTIEEFASIRGVSGNSFSSILRNLGYESLNFARSNNNSIKEINIRDYTDYTYKTIEDYVYSSKNYNISKDSSIYPIEKIEVNLNNSINYPTSNSWYYVNNKKISAYIEFDINNKKVGYCYSESIDNIKEGEC